MIAGVGIRDIPVLAAGLPVEPSGFHDDPAQCCSMSAQELGRRMDYDISAVFNGADQIRSTEGIIDDKRQAVLMGELRDGIDR